MSSRDAREKATDFQVDPAGRVTRITYADGAASTFEYGKSGSGATSRLVMMTDESGRTGYDFDSFGSLLAKKQIVGAGSLEKYFVLSYTYGSAGASAGHVSSMTYPSGNRIDIAYGPDGRPLSLTLVAPGAASPVVLLKDIAYAPFGGVIGWTWGNSEPTKPNRYWRSVDVSGRVTSYPLGLPEKGGSVRTIHYDLANRIVSLRHEGGIFAANRDQDFKYDGLDRLLTVDGPGIHQGFEYDENGNRIEARFGDSTYRNVIRATSNRLDSASGPAPSKSYQIDAAGNIVSDGSTSYLYGPNGRLKAATMAGVTTSYRYNGLGQRVAKFSKDALKSVFVYDERGHIVGEYDGAGKVLNETVYLGDIPVAVLTATQVAGPMIPPPMDRLTHQPSPAAKIAPPTSVASSTPSAPQSVLTQSINSTSIAYIYSDHINTPRVLVRAGDNAIIWRWDNADPFGLIHPDENPSGLGVFSYSLRFPGQTFDRETNNHYNYFRDYDPQTGRYLQSDPIGLAGGINTYGYVRGNPTQATDALGLWGSTVHAHLIRSAFPNLPSVFVDAIIRGSESVDAAMNQIPGVGNDFEHAMRNANQTPQQAKDAMCAFIRRNMDGYRRGKDSGGRRGRTAVEAYEMLGMALHPIMDSTSPVHRGFQIWRPIENGVSHGNAHGSLEGMDSLTPQLQNETINLMLDLLRNPESCPCT